MKTRSLRPIDRSPMQELVSPKQVARAIGVSESSVKRWCDAGLLPAHHTPGGHRRIAISDALQFLIKHDHQIIEPELLGLPATIGRTDRVLPRAAQQFQESLLAGDELRCRQVAFDLYLAQHSISTICDQIIAPVFGRIGELWECGAAEIYEERRSCELTLRVIHELRGCLPQPPANAPLAIGGAPEGDPYNLATSMVELVLKENGWRAISLGDNLPLDSLRVAIRKQQPQLFWLSASHLADSAAFLADYTKLYAEWGADVAIVVGGQALTSEVRQQMAYGAYCDNLKHLESFSQTLLRKLNP